MVDGTDLPLLRLDVLDEELWRRTLDAVGELEGRRGPRVVVRCRKCGAQLAGLDVTSHGPIFASTWEAQSIPEAGQDATVAQALTMLMDLERGREARRGVVALIGEALAEYPDLVVRCDIHGEAVLDRHDALRHLCEVAPGAKARPWRVVTSFPLRRHRPMRRDFD